MKRSIWTTHLLSAVFAGVLSISAVGCLVTGFDLTVEDLRKILLLYSGFSLLFSLFFRLRYGTAVLLSLAALAAGYLWRSGFLTEQLQSFLQSVSRFYHAAYGWPVLCAGASSGPVDRVLCVLGLLIALNVSWVCCRRKNSLLALPGAVLCLVACLVVTDTVPDTVWLYLMMLATALLLLTDHSRRRGSAQGNRLVAIAAIPVAAALAGLFLAVPQNSYVNQYEEFQDRLVDLFLKSQSLAEDVSADLSIGTSGSSDPERLDLSAVGPKARWDYTVMEVTSPVNGTLYLRGRDYNTYGGSGWVASRHRVESFSQGSESLGTLKIRTRTARDILYVPYYPLQEVSLMGGALENPQNLREYTFELAAVPGPPDSDGSVISVTPAYLSSAAPDSQYRQLPADTTLWANPLSREITDGCTTVREMAAAISDYVRGSASYDLDTDRMPDGTKDFVQWFLKESDTGYCVHFASAATVLLRAAGIPARYVEGYMISCEAGREISVSSNRAHAWAEYYDSQTGAWQILEATPADPDAPAETQTEPSSDSPASTVPEQDIPESSAPTAPEAPTGSPSLPEASAPQPPEPEAFRLPGWAVCICAALLLTAAVWGQSALRIRRKRRLWCGGTPNEQALARYAQLQQLSRLLKSGLPDDVEALAQKARFSQHTLTRDELDVFDICRREYRALLRKAPLYRHLLLRLLPAVE